MITLFNLLSAYIVQTIMFMKASILTWFFLNLLFLVTVYVTAQKVLQVRKYYSHMKYDKFYKIFYSKTRKVEYFLR